jgi:hypothetical protein
VSNVTGANVTDGVATGTISNDDGGGGGPTLTIADVSIAEGNSLTKLLTFTVSLSAPAGGTVSYDIATHDGTASAAETDYVAKSLTGQTILSGASSRVFRVTINGDDYAEPDETFTVTVTNVSGATVGDGTAVGTITNDDGALTGPAMASLRWPGSSAPRSDTEVFRLAEAARLLCRDLGTPALVAMRGARDGLLAQDFAGLANAGDASLVFGVDCAPLPHYRAVSAASRRQGAEVPALLVDEAKVSGARRAELVDTGRLFESLRVAGSREWLFETPPLHAHVQISLPNGKRLDVGLLVLGREEGASPTKRAAQAEALVRWLWTQRSADPDRALAIAGTLAASELRGFLMGELAAPRAASRGEHLLGDARLLDAARDLGRGEACSLAHKDGVGCALAELQFLP